MKRTNLPDPEHDEQAEESKQLQLQHSLRLALQDLIDHTGSDGFLVRFATDSGETFYLAFGKFETLRQFVAEPPGNDSGSNSPTIH